MPPRRYAAPEGFRQALETRVRAAAGPSGMGRFRQVLVYDRFLARVFSIWGSRRGQGRHRSANRLPLQLSLELIVELLNYDFCRD